MKTVYRILALVFLFAGSLFYFGSNMREIVFSAERKTTEMQETTLPVVTILAENQEINLLHGYCSNLDAMLVRESITPLTAEKAFQLLITENEYNIKKVNYEVYETALGTKLEEGSVISLDKHKNADGEEESGKKTAKIRLRGEYAAGEEYVVKLTLISNESKRIYYYTRIKLYTNSHLAEKLEYVAMFHSSLIQKEKASAVKKYLETKKNADETDFSRANIYNSLDFLSYGELAPQEQYALPPTITEYTQDMASVVLGSYLLIQTPTGPETYYVREHFRFQYTPSRIYLFNYERTMEAVFDVKNTSLSKSEFKLGITGDTSPEMLANTDGTRVAFVRNGSLYVYSSENNLLTTVFSFRQQESDHIRDEYDKHGIKLLSIDGSGAVDFLVYGYMNRGEYEGRVGMLLYTYHPSDQTIEERAYFPMNTTYELLKETLGKFAYCSREEIFYFHIYDTIYEYNLITKSFSVIAENVTEETMVYSRDRHTIAWQSADEQGRTDTVHLLDLDTGERTVIRAKNGEILGLLGMIDANLILGSTAAEDVEILADGTRIAAYRTVEIVDFSGSSLKTYQKDGYFVTSVQVEDNVLRLERVTGAASGSRKYQAAEEDYILNQFSQRSEKLKVTERVTELMRKEYYLSLPSGITISRIPDVQVTKNTVISEDVTVRVNTPDYFGDFYLAYAYGNVVNMTKEPGAAIALADNTTGSVITSGGRVIWTRGVKAASADIAGVGTASQTENTNSLMTCVKLLLEYRNVEADIAQYRPERGKLTDWLEQYLREDVMKLSGITLDEALYYVYCKTPVIAVGADGSAMLITGYDKSGITAVQPERGRKRHLTMREAENFLGGSDYYFIAVW
ncbi:MAG: hypothetical protein K2N94_00270 [Lachnospiraceae bacterium]|nr:hypothetical protein [Lachnospiraceae bacterium]